MKNYVIDNNLLFKDIIISLNENIKKEKKKFDYKQELNEYFVNKLEREMKKYFNFNFYLYDISNNQIISIRNIDVISKQLKLKFTLTLKLSTCFIANKYSNNIIKNVELLTPINNVNINKFINEYENNYLDSIHYKINLFYDDNINEMLTSLETIKQNINNKESIDPALLYSFTRTLKEYNNLF